MNGDVFRLSRPIHDDLLDGDGRAVRGEGDRGRDIAMINDRSLGKFDQR